MFKFSIGVVVGALLATSYLFVDALIDLLDVDEAI
jgi:hypothetical protein